ncbi:outer membrane lipoprotein LolB [Candidatus Vallotiella sp. (ex Adelges kitamiensis)]|uniref:outer membrane lipoprotein LolB n=1 Tax=Candidatus Vallotiella sp. (ex Adelges kitamiensis) TaxID=2864217 RepID=UPI001CE2DBC2|nr:outer membrane lipoprotein LolB [Candidatus Vallotia sp. (ex Adelges kitamiensis)]
MRYSCVTLSLSLIALLASCATLQQSAQTVSDTGDAKSRQTVYTYHGRFTVRYQDQSRNSRTAYGNFNWYENDQTITLKLLDPFNEVLAIVVAGSELASLELPNERPQIAPSISELMRSTLGFLLPVKDLRYWLRPLASPDSHALTSTDSANHLRRIDQDGWNIKYLAYTDAPENRIKIIHLTQKALRLSIKLVLD